jgi:hypothetical protein
VDILCGKGFVGTMQKVFIVAPRVGKIFRLAGLKNICIPLDDRIAQIIAS